MALSEVTYISQFNIMPNGCIGVQKTTDVLRDGEVISSNYWRTTLVPNDPQACIRPLKANTHTKVTKPNTHKERKNGNY